VQQKGLSRFLGLVEGTLTTSSRCQPIIGKYAEELMATAKYLATPRKGLLAADESTSRDNWEATGQHPL
jgi:hypothetical protein